MKEKDPLQGLSWNEGKGLLVSDLWISRISRGQKIDSERKHLPTDSSKVNGQNRCAEVHICGREEKVKGVGRGKSWLMIKSQRKSQMTPQGVLEMRRSFRLTTRGGKKYVIVFLCEDILNICVYMFLQSKFPGEQTEMEISIEEVYWRVLSGTTWTKGKGRKHCSLGQYYRYIHGKNMHWKPTMCQALAIHTTVTKVSWAPAHTELFLLLGKKDNPQTQNMIWGQGLVSISRKIKKKRNWGKLCKTRE